MKKGLSPQSCLAICHPRDVRECRRSNCFQVKIFLSTYCRNRRKSKTKFASQLSATELLNKQRECHFATLRKSSEGSFDITQENTKRCTENSLKHQRWWFLGNNLKAFCCLLFSQKAST